MLQHLINIVYRYPRSDYHRIKKFGGFIAYRRMMHMQRAMMKAAAALKPEYSAADGLPVYFLTGKKYLYQTLFCIKSLCFHANGKFRFILVDDGTFDQALIDNMRHQLPGAEIVTQERIIQNLDRILPKERFPVIRNKRETYPHLRKLTDIHILEDNNWKLVLDSDMLFCDEPAELLQWLKNPDRPLHLVEREESYGYEMDLMEQFAGTGIPRYLNVGVIGLNSDAIDWGQVENWISGLEKAGGKTYYLEQALSAMLMAGQIHQGLNASRYIVNPVIAAISNGSGVLHHYVDTSKVGNMPAPNQPLVSVIIPVFNAGDRLKAAVDSAMAQTWSHKEIIIIDDGSVDHSFSIAASYQAQGVQVFRQFNRGASAARNKGLQVAKGDFIQFLDADDLLSPDKIESQVEVLRRHSRHLAVCSTVHFPDGFPESNYRPSAYEEAFLKDSDNSFEFLVRLMGGYDFRASMVQPAAWLTPRQLIDQAGPWNESLTLDDDGEYFARVLLESEGIRKTPGLVFYRKYFGLKGNLSSLNNREGLESLFRSTLLKASWLYKINRNEASEKAVYKQLVELQEKSFLTVPDLYHRINKELAALPDWGYRPAPGGKLINLESDRWFTYDRYPRRLIRRIFRGKPVPSGQYLVFFNLIQGLKKIGIPFRLNDYKYIQANPSEIACIIGRDHLLDIISWKNPIVFGAAFGINPVANPDILEKYPIRKLLVPGQWVKEFFTPYGDDNVIVWPVGIDTAQWVPSSREKKIDFLIYNKIRWDKEKMKRELVDPVKKYLAHSNFSFTELCYGEYKPDELKERLALAKYAIFLCEHETQGIAYQQILASGVPVLAWDRGGFWQDPYWYPHRIKFQPVTSVPYWDNRCGVKFQAYADFGQQLNRFLGIAESANGFDPRAFINENLTIYLFTYNRHNLLPRAVESLLSQTMTEWVCDVHNDNPADPFPERYIASLNDNRFFVVNHPVNLGAVRSFNLAFAGCAESYASILEDDNWWEPQFLAEMIALMEDNPAVNVAWSNMKLWKEKPGNIWIATGKTVWPVAEGMQLFERPTIHQAIGALHSNSAMIYRGDRAANYIVPENSLLNAVELIRERAFEHPVAMLFKPLANFAVTMQTYRSADRYLWTAVQVMLLASFVTSAPDQEEIFQQALDYYRRKVPNPVAIIFLANLFILRRRSWYKYFTFKDWITVSRWLLKNGTKLHYLRSYMSTQQELTEFLNHKTAQPIVVNPLIPVPPEKYGGIERIVFMLIQELLRMGHDITLYAHPASEPNCRLVPYEEPVRPSLRDKIRINRLTFSILDEGFELVHTFGRMSNLGLLMLSRIPKVVSYQLLPTLSQVKKAVKIARRRSLYFSACSDYIANKIKAECDITTIYNGVDTTEYQCNTDVDLDAPIVFLGRIQEEKGTAIAIQVARETNRKLIIAGNIPDEALHRRYFDEQVKPFIDGRQILYIGPVNNSEKNELLRNAAALLMPVLWDEPFGIVMAEALACGTPVIGFRRGAVPEVVANGVNGYLVTTIPEMVAAVARIGTINRLKCREIAEKKFSAPPTTNPRLVKEVDALVRLGFGVKVIYAFYNTWAQPFDEPIFLKYPGTFLLVGGSPCYRKSAYLKTRIRQRLFRKIWKRVNVTGIAEGAISRTHQEALGIAKKDKADLFIAHNLGALPAAVMAAGYHGSKVGYDAEDLHSGQYNSTRDHMYQLNKYIEEKYFCSVDYFTAASPLIAEHYQRMYPYLNPTVGPQRGIEMIIEAMAKTDVSVQLSLLGNCSENDRVLLVKLATANGLLSNQLLFHEPIPADALFEFAAQFDVGMASETNVNLNRDLCLTNKIFTYLQCGLAILASDTRAQAKFMRHYPDTGLLYDKNDANALAAKIRHFGVHPDQLHAASRPATIYKQLNKRLLIISPYFAPANAADMHRIRMSLPYFSANGWDAELVTVDEIYLEIGKDPLLTLNIPSGTIIHKIKPIPKKYTAMFGLGSVAIRSLWAYLQTVNVLLKTQSFDLVYFSTTQFPVCILGTYWKKRFKIPFVIDLQDPWHSEYYLNKPANQRPPKYWFAYRLNKYLEPIAIKQADGLISVSEKYITTLQKRYPEIETTPWSVIPFGAFKPDLPVAKANSKLFAALLQPGFTNIVYVGRGGLDMHPALSLLFEGFKKGLADHPELFKRIKLYFIGTSYAPQGRGVPTVLPLARDYAIEDQVIEITDRINYYHALATLDNAAALIIPGSDDPQYSASKLYPYLLSQKPLMLILNSHSPAVRILDQSSRGQILVTLGHPEKNRHHLIYETLKKWASAEFEPLTLLPGFKDFSAEILTLKQAELFNTALGVLWIHCWTIHGNPRWFLWKLDLADFLAIGVNGVELFFVISGFCMYYFYAAKREFSFRDFYRFLLKRWVRLAPAFYVAALIYLLVNRFVYHQEVHFLFAYLHDVFFLDYFLGNYQTAAHFWTLTVEWQFYFIIPLVLIYQRVIGGIEFGFGILTARLLLRTASFFKQRVLWMLLFLVVVYAGRILVSRPVLLLLPEYYNVFKLLGFAVMGAGFAGVLYLSVTSEGKLAIFLGNNVFKKMGRISYSFYLLHALVYPVVAGMVINHIPELKGISAPVVTTLYYVPIFKLLQQRNKIAVKVFYTEGVGALHKFDHGFNKTISWDIPLLDGYDFDWVPNTAKVQGSHHFQGIVNPDLTDRVEAWQPDQLLVIGWAYNSHLKAIRYFKNKIPVCFRGDSTNLDEIAGVRALLKRLFLKWVYRHIDLAFYVGTNSRNYFKKYGFNDDQLLFAPHAVDNLRFSISHRKEAETIRRSMKIAPHEIVILFAGKLERKKAPQLLLAAFKGIEFPNIHLVFTGNGELEAELKSNAEGNPRIHFLEFQNQSAMPAVYQACDLFCLPSSGPNETWGLAVNEAMACGKAILVSDKVGCAVDLVRPGENGAIFKAGDLQDLREKIASLVSDPDQLKLYGRQRLATFFKPDKRLNKLMKNGIVWLTDEPIAIYTAADNYIENAILCTGTYEDKINKLIRISLKYGGNALDIGGNIGLQSIRMAQATGLSGKILAFEPLNYLQQKFRKNLALNGVTNVQLLPYALSNHETITDYKVNTSSWNQGTFSLRQNEQTGEIQQVTVKVADELPEIQELTSINLIKIDVEGFEFNVIRGLSQTIRKHLPRIIFEYDANYWLANNQNIGECYDFLKSLGYQISDLIRSRELLANINSLPNFEPFGDT
eukprot:gene13983-14100_t